MIENSFIYTGEVIHKRFKPKEHFFKYSVFSLLIDLSEIRLINKKIPFFYLGPKNDWKKILDEDLKIKLNDVFKKNLVELSYN